jgi:hypothetical protein
MTKAIMVIALVLCVTGAAQARRAAEVQVLAAHKGWIPDSGRRTTPNFGVNGTRLMWLDSTPFTDGKRRALDVSASRTSVTGRWPAGLAFAGERTAGRTIEGGLSLTNAVGVSDRRGGSGVEFDMPHEGAGGYLTHPYAVGSTIAYGWYETAIRKGSCDEDGFDCDYKIRRGGLRLFDGVKLGRLVTRAPVAVLTLSSAGTAAYVRATSRWHLYQRGSGARGPSVIEVISLQSPRVLLRIRAPGRVTAPALSDRVLVAGTQLPNQRQALLFYDLWGRRLRVFRLGGFNGDYFSDIAVKGSRVVLNYGKALLEIEAYSGSKRVLARTGRGTGGVAFAGDKLVWHEHRGQDTTARYRILAMSIDRR